mgnify:CR=1 FL=1
MIPEALFKTDRSVASSWAGEAGTPMSLATAGSGKEVVEVETPRSAAASETLSQCARATYQVQYHCCCYEYCISEVLMSFILHFCRILRKRLSTEQWTTGQGWLLEVNLYPF